MSPASAGTLEVERYIGACLISHNRSKGVAVKRDFAPPEIHRQRHVNYHLQRCQSSDGWAGGMPLISFANRQMRGGRDHEDPGSLARLAVHAQGAPLILSKSFNHRKSKVSRNDAKVFESSKKQTNSADTVSVASDESSGSANSETCLPRIIKPRKRRKKDRKPPLLDRPSSLDGFSTDSASPDIENAQQPGYVSFGPFVPFNFDSYNTYRPCESPKLIDRLHILGDISETPKLHHAFEDVEEPDDGKDVNGNQSTSTCQCRYCDPSGQIWDVDRDCYSPFLTPPNSHTKAFQFPSLATPYSSSVSTSCLEHCMSSISLEEEEGGKKIPTSRSSSSSSCRDLEVSTEIVTSLNGHRDLEIRFFSSSSCADGARDREGCMTRRCDVNSELGLMSEE